MKTIRTLFLGTLVAAALCGCVNSKQAAIDQAYHDGRITSAERDRQTQELVAERQAGAEASMVQNQQQPTQNPNYDKTVWPQPIESNGYVHGKDN